MVTEAVQQVLGDRAVGICDSPSGLCRRVAAALDRDPGELWFDYFGLNHLGWLRGVRDAGGAAAARRPARGRRTACKASRKAACSAASGCARWR